MPRIRGKDPMPQKQSRGTQRGAQTQKGAEPASNKREPAQDSGKRKRAERKASKKTRRA